jgi:gamma-glutamylcyclotransferase (GGCT)/AIG2-like uncharacterized protein YtfP
MEMVCGLAEFTASPAILRDYKRVKIKDEVYPGILPCPGESVAGRLYGGLDKRALATLDSFEGEVYLRTRVTVETSTHLAECEAYVVKEEYYHLLSNAPWDFAIFLREGKPLFLSSYRGFSVVQK